MEARSLILIQSKKMESRTYKTNWIPIAVILFGGAFMWGVVSMERAINASALFKAVLIIVLGSLGVVFLIAKATYVTVTEDGYIKNVDFLFFRKKTKIQNITKIEKAPMYKGLGSIFGHVTHVYFIDEQGKEDAFEIKNNLYKEKTLVAIIKEIKKINSNIQLDKAHQKMIDKQND